jgi:cation:H+ antiporter
MGSNIFNLLLILGIGGLVLPLAIRPPTWKHDLPLYVLAAMAVGICGNEQLIDGLSISEITRSDGMLFLMFFGIFLYYTLGSARVAQVGDSGGQNNAPPKPQRMGKSITGIVVGLVGLVGGGELIVRGATGVAQEFGLGQNLIGMLIVGPGTSFPELIATIVAVVKKQTNLGVGNVIGSNIFNIFFTLGITSLIQPLPLPWLLNYAVLVNVGAALLLMIYGLGRRHQIGRTKAISFLLFYAAYVSLLILWNVRHA